LPLVSRAQEQLRLGRELLDRLGVEYQRVHEGYRAEEIVHVVEGHTAIRQWVGQVHDAATTELAAFVRAPGDLAGDGGDPFACAGVPGPRVRRRLVFERAGIEASGVGRGIDPAARVADKLPVRLCLVDRSLALLPLAADARPPDPVMLVIRPSGLLDALVTLFESVWASSVPLGRRDVEHPHTALQLRVLAMLVSGSTDTAMARSLGVAVRTVQRHIAAMQRDAGVDNRVQLVWYAARHRWLDDDSGAQEVVPSAWREPDAG
ncbi:MAG TPA: helix-turn-helix transcriptional regulator, partial [Streptomyces sp.]